jgi:hypothetical protein
MSMLNFAFDNASATTKGRLKGRVDTSAFTSVTLSISCTPSPYSRASSEEQLAKHETKKARSRASTAKAKYVSLFFDGRRKITAST